MDSSVPMYKTKSRLNDAKCSDITIQSKEKKVFPWGWQPGENDVIIGRGKRCHDHTGNIKFRRLVEVMMKDYIRFNTRTEKSIIITALIDHVRRISPEGGFVKRNPATGQFYDVGNLGAREMTSQTFRNALHELYASSKMSKRKSKQTRLAKLESTKQNNTVTSLQRRESVESSQPSPFEKVADSELNVFSSEGDKAISFDSLISRFTQNDKEFGDVFEPLPIQHTDSQSPTTIQERSTTPVNSLSIYCSAEFGDPFEPLPIQETVFSSPAIQTGFHSEIDHWNSCQVVLC